MTHGTATHDGDSENAVEDWSFTTSRIHGRLLAASDEAFYVGLFSDPGVMAQIAEPLSSVQAAINFIKACRHNANPRMRARYWFLSQRETGAAIGLLSLLRGSDHPNSAELGLMLMPQWQGRGVGLHALRAVVEAVLSDRWALGIGELIGRHAASNPSAGRLVEALGFQSNVEGDAIVWRLRCDPVSTSSSQSLCDRNQESNHN